MSAPYLLLKAMDVKPLEIAVGSGGRRKYVLHLDPTEVELL
jgi:hypothetical protein